MHPRAPLRISAAVAVTLAAWAPFAHAEEPPKVVGHLPARTATADIINIDLPAASQTDTKVVTQAIQNAIDHGAKSDHATIIIPAGDYTVAPLKLASNLTLKLEKGANLHFSRNVADYPLVTIDDGDGPTPGVMSPIYGENLTNVSITGEGTIDGQGDAWRAVKQQKLTPQAWDKLVKSGGLVGETSKETETPDHNRASVATTSASNGKGDKTWFPSEVVRDGKKISQKLIADHTPLEGYEPYKILLRPHLVRLTNCTNVKIDGVTFTNGAAWNVHLCMCDNVDIRHMTVFTEAWAQNGDGIDLDSCRNVTLMDSKLDAGDDGICIKSGKDEAGRKRGRPSENITIVRCTVGTGHGGVVIGSEMSGGVRHINVSDCVFNGTDNGLRFKATRGRGGVVEDIHVDRVKMTNIHGTAVLFDLYYAANGKPTPQLEKADETTPSFQNFDIQHVTCDGAGTALLLRGLPEMPLKNIRLSDVTITHAQKAGLISCAEDITLNNVHVTADDGKVKIDSSAKVSMPNTTGVGE